eukprot:scpid87021/ scgid26603/ 
MACKWRLLAIFVLVWSALTTGSLSLFANPPVVEDPLQQSGSRCSYLSKVAYEMHSAARRVILQPSNMTYVDHSDVLGLPIGTEENPLSAEFRIHRVAATQQFYRALETYVRTLYQRVMIGTKGPRSDVLGIAGWLRLYEDNLLMIRPEDSYGMPFDQISALEHMQRSAMFFNCPFNSINSLAKRLYPHIDSTFTVPDHMSQQHKAMNRARRLLHYSIIGIEDLPQEFKC